MTKPRIIVVIPTVRPEQYKSFIATWKSLFEKHQVTLVTVWDGEIPYVSVYNYDRYEPENIEYKQTLYSTHKNLIYRYTDACRNLGFIVASHLMKSPDDILITLDDDVQPLSGIEKFTTPDIRLEKTVEVHDPIQDHLDVLQKRVSLSWMNTAHDTNLYLRGVPYNIRNEAQVMLSHGVWVGIPDFDGETQLQLEQKEIPYSLPYYVGPIPKGVLFPCCGMNLAIKRDALPYFYFAPMGVDTKIGVTTAVDSNNPLKGNYYGGPNRFADIWMGIFLKNKFDELGWACYTGGSTILHTRASDAKKNFEQEKLGREWNEWLIQDCEKCSVSPVFIDYMTTYQQKRILFLQTIQNIFLKNKLDKLGLSE